MHPTIIALILLLKPCVGSEFIHRVKPLALAKAVWRHSYDKAIYRDSRNDSLLTVYRPNGDEYRFERSDTSDYFYIPRLLISLLMSFSIYAIF